MGLGRQASLRMGIGQVGLHPQPAWTERAGQWAGSHQCGGNPEGISGFEQHVSI